MKCNHLSVAQESYGQHLRFTIYICFVLLLLSIASIVHGLIPWILISTTSDKIKHLNEVLKERS